MSNRDSLGFGDLLPQDVVQIFAQEKHSKKGRKKRSHSLGRALGWLKGKKGKDGGTNGQNPGLGPALDLALDGKTAGNRGGHKGGQKLHLHGNSQAVSKRDDKDSETPAPVLLQENVFIEASRPKYLEDLHTEAQEGLKMLQQEETTVGMEYQDSESTISTRTVQTDTEGGGFTTDSTIADSTSMVSVQSSVSNRSSRSGLTRQGSTFRPLNSGKKAEKTRRKRHRKTVAGIPQHVQRELGLDREGWTMASRLEEELFYNGESDLSPTSDGPQQASESPKGSSAQPPEIKVTQPLNTNEGKQIGVTHAGHRDDMALLQHMGPDLSDADRPRSLAVPWMTTAHQQDPPSPVITTSPQAAYMSKIIPNAVLPPSIDVVEINRGRSRSLRTVSKNSLTVSSPAPSRASSRASSSRTTSSRMSSITSASRQNNPNMSDSSCWSNSESSETLVSDSSTISGKSTPGPKKSQDGYGSAREDRVSVYSSSSKGPRCTSNGMVSSKVEVKKDGQFVRSLSIMKSKKAPPPPSRSYSLHNKMKRRSRDITELSIIPGESYVKRIPPLGEENEKNRSEASPSPSKLIDSPGYNADTSSLDESMGSGSLSPIISQALKSDESLKTGGKFSSKLQGKKQDKMISPSSGYSSQDATSPKPAQQPRSASPKHKKSILSKFQKLFSPGVGPSPLVQPGAVKGIRTTGGEKCDVVDTVNVSASVRTLRELFNIPPHPTVHAPPPPPPEVWCHSKRSIELLLGPPVPDNLDVIIKKNPKDRRQQRRSPSVSTEGSVNSVVVDRKYKNPAVTVETVKGSSLVVERQKVQESVILNAEVQKENNERLAQNVDLKATKVADINEKVRGSDILNGMLAKAVEKREERLSAAKRDQEVRKISTTEFTHIATSPAISLARISTSTSSSVSHQPPQPLTKQAVSPESSWPPPPPPISQTIVGGPDEEFPPPPPPLLGEVVSPVERSIPGGGSTTTSKCTVVIAKAEPQRSSSSQGITPANSIPPPPPYAAPPPPVTTVSSTTKMVCLPPIQVSLPPPKVISPPPPPPPPPQEVSLPPPKVISPPPPPSEELLLPSPKVTSSPPPPPPPELSLPSLMVISPPPPPMEVSSPPPMVISPTPLKEVSSPPPPPKVIFAQPVPLEVCQPPPKDICPPPAQFSLKPPKAIPPPPPPKVIFVQPVPPEVCQPPPKDICPPPVVLSLPPPKSTPLPPPEEVHPPSTTDASLPSLPEEVSPTPPQPEEVSPTPQSEEVSPPPQPEEVSPPPQPEEVSPTPQSEEVSPTPQPEEVSPPPEPEEVSPTPPQPKEVSPTLQPQEVSPTPPQPKEDSPPPEPKEVSPPPQPKEVSPPPQPKEDSPPPQPKEDSPPSQPKEDSPQPEEVSAQSQSEDLSPPSPQKVFTPPPEEISLPPANNPPSESTTLYLQPSDFAPTPPKEVSSPPPVEDLPVKQSLPPSGQDAPCPSVIEVSSVPLEEASVLCAEEVVLLSEENTTQSSGEVFVGMLKPPQSIPPPPPVQLLEQDVDLKHQIIQSECETNPVSSESIITPPQSIPPPTQIEVLHQPEVVPANTESPSNHVVPQLAPSEISIPITSPEEPKQPVSPPTANISLPIQTFDSIKHPSDVESTENQSQEQTSAPEELAQIGTTIIRNPEATNTQEQPQTEVTVTKEHPSNPVPSSSASGEAPQKPIRRSLIISSPVIITSSPTPHSPVSPPASSVPVPSPSQKSPPVTIAHPSMNLQEAIRLRTAARSKDKPVSRLRLHSPTSPDLRTSPRSPTSTASFIFSKSNKRVVIESKTGVQNNMIGSSATKVMSEVPSPKKAAKLPPPVAKKPKSKATENGTSEGTAQTAGQEAQ